MFENEVPTSEDFILKEEALFQSKRHVSYLFKKFLIILEDMRVNHQINFSKFRDSLPEGYSDLIEMGDYFSEKHFSHLRKRVLDAGGETIRNIESDIKKL